MVRGVDVHGALTGLIEAKKRRDEWAQIGLKASRAGKKKQAHVALRKAEFWERKVQQILAR